MYKTFQIALIVLSGLTLLTGCSGSTPQASSEQVKDFKGAPMPESAKAQFEAGRKAAADAAMKKAAAGANSQHDAPPN